MDKKREACRQCKAKHITATWKALRPACKEVRAAIDKGIEVHLEEYVAELETLLRHRDIRGFYKHLKMTAGLGGREPEGQQAITDENGNLLRDKGDILRRWERFFGNLLNTKSPALQPSIVEKVQQRRKAPPSPPPGARSQIEEPIPLEAEPTYAETQKAVRAMVNRKEPGADSLPVELLKLDDPTRVPVVLKHFQATLVRVWGGEKIPQKWKDGRRSQIEEPIPLEAEPTYAETQKAVRAMVNRKEPGADSLPVELLKLDDPTRVPVVLKHFQATLVRVWGGEKIPQKWKDAPIRLQQLPRDFTRLTRRQSTAEARRQSP